MWALVAFFTQKLQKKFWKRHILASESLSSNSLHLNVTSGPILGFQTFCTYSFPGGHCTHNFRHFLYFFRSFSTKHAKHCWLFLIMGSCGFSALCGTSLSSFGNSGRVEWIPPRKLKFKLTLQTRINGGGQAEKFIFHKGVLLNFTNWDREINMFCVYKYK